MSCNSFIDEVVFRVAACRSMVNGHGKGVSCPAIVVEKQQKLGGVTSRSSTSAFSEYVCGGIASLVNITLTFPLNKVMFRQQIQGIRLHHALHQIHKEGLLYLYRGLLPPLLQRTATVSLMFGSYAHYYDLLRNSCPDMNRMFIHTAAAIGAGSTEAIFVPLERVQVVLQVKDFHRDLRNTADAFVTISRLGVGELYRGVSAVLLRNGPSNALFLGLRQPLKEALPCPDTMFGQSLSAFLSGAGLGASLSTAFFPLNVVKNKMQARIGGPFLSLREALQETLAERGYHWRKLFRGVHINYTRSFMSWGIINTVYELLIRHFRTEP